MLALARVEWRSAVNDRNDVRTNQNDQPLSTGADSSAIPLAPQPLGADRQDRSSDSQQAGEHLGKDQDGKAQPEGAIPQAVEALEKAADKGLEKTSDVVGSTIDKVADAAINALGGKPKEDDKL